MSRIFLQCPNKTQTENTLAIHWWISELDACSERHQASTRFLEVIVRKVFKPPCILLMRAQFADSYIPSFARSFENSIYIPQSAWGSKLNLHGWYNLWLSVSRCQQEMSSNCPPRSFRRPPLGGDPSAGRPKPHHRLLLRFSPLLNRQSSSSIQ